MTDPLIKTIHTLAADGNIAGIIAIAEGFRADRDRAEAKVQAYLHEIKVLAQRYAQITEPATGESVRKRTIPGQNSAPPDLGRGAGGARHTPEKKTPERKSKNGARVIDIEL